MYNFSTFYSGGHVSHFSPSILPLLFFFQFLFHLSKTFQEMLCLVSITLDVYCDRSTICVFPGSWTSSRWI